MPIARCVQHAHAADRFAREIIGILIVIAVRSRRLMGSPLDVRHPQPKQLICFRCVYPRSCMSLRRSWKSKRAPDMLQYGYRSSASTNTSWST